MSLLPFSYKHNLKPWFKNDDLKKGWELLASDLSARLFFRNFGGGLFSGENAEGRAIARFAPSPKLKQGFKIDSPFCSCCSQKQSIGNFCSHVAAVTLAFLVEKDEIGRLAPLPLSFQDSPWPDIAGYLHQEFDSRGERGSCSVAIHPGGGSMTGSRDDVQMQAEVDTLTTGLLYSRSPSRLSAVSPESQMPRSPEGCSILINDLIRLSLNEEERELFSRGHKTQGLQRDDSLWFWLARQLYLGTGRDSFVVEQDEDDAFWIRSGEGRDRVFILKPGRSRGCHLFKNLDGKMAGSVSFLPPAQAFWRVCFSDDSTAICCRPMLRLDSGEIFSREELASRRWGDCYHLPGRGFLPVQPVPHGANLRPPGTPVQPSLFGSSGEQQKTRESGFDISAPDFARFLEENQDALAHSHNEADQDLLSFEPVDKPDRIHMDLLDSDDDWCYLAAYYGLGNREIDLAEVLKARLQDWEYLPGKQWLKLKDTPLSWFHEAGADRLWQDGDGRQGLRLRRWEVLTLTAQLDSTISGAGVDRQDQALHLPLSMKWQELDGAEAPSHLRGYQKKGLDWLKNLLGNGMGGILADEMGLGKTHQALAFLESVAGHIPGASFLVVAPASVIYHWADKIDRFYAGLSWSVYHGSSRNLEECREKQVVLTTYGIVNRDWDELAGHFFEVIVFDEVQHLKNKKTKIHGAAAGLRAGIKLGLTGTPMENSPNDLKALLDICLPGILGSDRGFQRRFTTPIVEEQSEDRSRELSERISPFFLRRLRAQVVSELPEIIEDTRTCELHDDQVRLYREFIAGQGRELAEQLSDEGSEIPYMEVLALISHLKQICDHPCLVSGESDPEQYGCGKWDLFKELLNECLDSGYKVVVFSQYTSMLDLIEGYLQAIAVSRAGLRGKMTLKKRKQEISRFQNEDSCRVFCASLLAGGTGIDLTAAQCVIHYDRWWNAAREDQATSRVHRIGQSRVVEVFKLITAGTLEEKIDRLISRRRDLAGRLVQADDENLVKRLDRKDLLDLISF